MLYGLEKKHIRAFNLCLVILLGVSAGYLFSAVSSFYLQRRMPLPEAAVASEDVQAQRPGLQSYQVILKNNLFDPAHRNLTSFETSKKKAPNAQQVVVERKEMTLLGTVTSSDRPFAVIRIGADEHIAYLNEELPGGGKLVEIRREQVRGRNNDGSYFVLTLPQVVASASGPPAPPAKPGGTKSTGVKKVGDNRWIISRDEVDKARANMGTLMKQARLSPRVKNGEIQGFRVRMIRPRSFLWNLGLRRGDVLEEVNGVSLDSPEKGLEIFQQLQEARNISVGLQRRNKDLTFEYEIE